MAAPNALNLAGTMQQQFDNTFNNNGSPGNGLVLLNGRSVSMPSAGGGGAMMGSMTGGRRRRRRLRSRSRARGRSSSRRIRGGFMGSVVNQAVVPLALLGLQQTYRRRGTGFKGRKSRRGRRRR
jgi:hypothetical protein